MNASSRHCHAVEKPPTISLSLKRPSLSITFGITQSRTLGSPSSPSLPPSRPRSASLLIEKPRYQRICRPRSQSRTLGLLALNQEAAASLSIKKPSTTSPTAPPPQTPMQRPPLPPRGRVQLLLPPPPPAGPPRRPRPRPPYCTWIPRLALMAMPPCLPLAAVSLQIARAALWPRSWVPRPADPDRILRVARAALRGVLLLLPLFDRCYIPCRPCLTGNPIFFIDETRILCCSFVLSDFFHRESTSGSPSPSLRLHPSSSSDPHHPPAEASTSSPARPPLDQEAPTFLKKPLSP